MKKLGLFVIFSLMLIGCYSIHFTEKGYPSAEVINIQIDQDVNGPFCKSVVEIEFQNFKAETAEGRFWFRLNKNSFIKEMQLLINGTWEKDITFSSQTGENIYNEIRGPGKRHLVITPLLDPAILYKIHPGRYLLKVFPIAPNEVRKVKLEIYSLLENDNANELTWQFQFGRWSDKNISFTLNHKASKSYSAFINDEPFSLQTDNIFKDNKSSGAIISYSYLSESYNKEIGNFIYQRIDSIRQISNYTYLEKDSIANLLVKIIKSSKDSLIISDPDISNDLFFHEFSEYLRNDKGKTIIFGSDWFSHDIHHPFIEINYYLKYAQNSSTDTTASNNYTNEFIHYFTSYHSPISDQIEAKILTENTTKLVPEKSADVDSIIQKHLSIENNNPSSISSEPLMRFIPFDVAPIPVGGYDAIQKNVVYPALAYEIGLEGQVVVQAFIDENGNVVETFVLKSVNGLLDRSACLAVKMTKFIPAKQRDKNVSVPISIPVIFKIKGYVPPKNLEILETIYNKEFTFSFDKNSIYAFDEQYDKNNYREVKVGTDDCYEILYNNPGMIKYIYELLFYKIDYAGLSSNGVSILFQFGSDKDYRRVTKYKPGWLY